jgi:Rrf2 family protein
MRISAKGRYALAAMIDMAQGSPEQYIAVISIAERLGISKIYLEQVFSLLKKGGLVSSVKGSQGGYQLARPPMQITAFDILSEVETSLFEKADDTVNEKAPEIDVTLKQIIFDRLDTEVEAVLKSITLYELASQAQKHRAENGYMFFI